MAKKRSKAIRSSPKKQEMSDVIKLGVIFIIVSAIVLALYVGKNFL